jgi:2-polyprenyl-3-methyl-5-hydroxy-6-metoxy-1,4-benzoquinol methylase
MHLEHRNAGMAGIPADRFSYYDLNKDRLIKRLLGTEWRNADVLDLGCGPGLLSRWMADCGARVTGVDASVEELSKARMSTEGKVRLIKADIPILPDLGTFDLIIAKDIIEHVEDEDGFTELIARVLNPGGRLLISTHNSLSLQYVLAGTASFLHGRRYLGMDPDHVRMYSPSRIRLLLSRAALVPKTWLGCYHLPYRLLGGKWKRSRKVKLLHFIEDQFGTMKPFCYLGWSLTALAVKR